MEKFIAGLVKDFESGKINRRQFCETVALAATVYAAGDAAKAAPAKGLKMLGVNHVSYACTDYKVARDWYAKVFNTQIYNDKGMGRANLAFGPEQGKGGSFLITRNFGNNEKPAPATVDHICYTVANWDDAKVNDALKAAGTTPLGRKGSVNVYDPYGFQVQIASIDGENPFI
ncbi:MAG TPA: VOC family protein [Micropepsaceae bacterium]|jgi:catechol 2,3-dioxygenase-like lactoylglutathione lyase family enzyme|nr:VOC family protein [Micropepsaceae bacterium]